MPVIRFTTSQAEADIPVGIEHDLIRSFCEDSEVPADRVAALVEGGKRLVNGLNNDAFALCTISAIQHFSVPIRDKIAVGIFKVAKEKLHLEDHQVLITYHQLSNDDVAIRGSTITTFFANQHKQ